MLRHGQFVKEKYPVRFLSFLSSLPEAVFFHFMTLYNSVNYCLSVHKEAVVVYFKVQPWHFPAGTEKSHENLQSG
jgi:hypothetical protein